MLKLRKNFKLMNIDYKNFNCNINQQSAKDCAWSAIISFNLQNFKMLLGKQSFEDSV